MIKNQIVLFTILFFSTVTPLEMQANLDWTALRNKTLTISQNMKKWVNGKIQTASYFLKKHNKTVETTITIIGCLFGLIYLLRALPISVEWGPSCSSKISVRERNS